MNNKEKIIDLYYKKIIPLLICDDELYCNYLEKNIKENEIETVIKKDIQNDFNNNIIKIENDFNELDYGEKSLEIKNAKKVYNEIKKVYKNFKAEYFEKSYCIE